uniref:pentapeptide repeat-containing protein n=1 Tax=Trichocoleus desertorum TaxID=1481672 RepID=UPI0025B2B03D|nr:pentapeptide repeat-containing protein [Trichocoleus desertorum]
MSFAIIYCAEIFQGLGQPDDPDHLRGLGLGLVWGISFIPSLFFLAFSSTWVAKNFSMVVSCYFTSSLVASIVMNFLRNGPSPFEDFGLYLLVLVASIFLFLLLFFPLVILVSTTAYLVVQLLPYRSTWASTSFEGANLTGANFSNAALGNTNFRAAHVETACFYRARNLYPQLFEKTCLAKPKLLAKAITELQNTH